MVERRIPCGMGGHATANWSHLPQNRGMPWSESVLMVVPSVDMVPVRPIGSSATRTSIKMNY